MRPRKLEVFDNRSSIICTNNPVPLADQFFDKELSSALLVIYDQNYRHGQSPMLNVLEFLVPADGLLEAVSKPFSLVCLAIFESSKLASLKL